MTHTSIHTYTPTAKRFERVYNYTLLNLVRSECAPNNATLQILSLLSDAPQHHLIHALELWLFCEARKIYNTIQKAPLRKEVIRRDIVEPFIMQLSPEVRRNQAQNVEQLVYKTLAHMGFGGASVAN